MEDEDDLRDPYAQYAVHRRLVATARASGPLRVALARIAASILKRETWKRLGFVRIADYARERLGISRRDLQELGRVGARLDDLPELEAALADGRVSWSKARLIARVATGSDEGEWVERAQQMTVRGLSRAIRSAEKGSGDAGPEDDEDLPEKFFQLACSPEVRRQWHRVRELARRVAGCQVSAAECIDMMAAEVRSAVPLESDVPAEPHDRGGTSWSRVLREGREAGRPAADWPILGAVDHDLPVGGAGNEACRPAFLQELLEGLDELGPWGLDRRLRICLRDQQRLDSQIGALLSIVAKAHIHRRLEIESTARYAEEHLGFSKRKAQMLLRIERTVQASPVLARAYRGGEISWVQADLLVPMIWSDSLGRWSKRWIERAKRVSVRQLRDDVEHARMLRETQWQLWSETGGLPPEAMSEGDSEGAQTCASSTVSFFGDAELVAAFWATLWTVRKRIERVSGVFPTEGEAFKAMMEHVLDEWGADARVKREHRIMERDGWRCLVPGCTSRRSLHVHHVVARSQGGGDEESNLITLCALCRYRHKAHYADSRIMPHTAGLSMVGMDRYAA